MTARRVGRWDWTLGVAALLAGAGFWTQEPVLVVAAAVPLSYVAYGWLTGLPEPSVAVERRLEFDPTAPGEPVGVELTVTNESEAPVDDLRVVDGVPDPLPVVDGRPRGAFALDPGERATLEYAVGARRGTYEFDPVRVRARNAAGSAVATETVPAEGDAEVTCGLPVEAVPTTRETFHRAGSVTADDPGEGIEFHSVREYRRGDAVSDIDWRRYARTGDLTTVRYRQERAATVVLVVDDRDRAYVAPDDESPCGAALSAYAAERAFEALAATEHEVGLTTLRSPEDVIGPGTGDGRVEAARRRLDDVRERDPPVLEWLDPPSERDGEWRARELDGELPGTAQVVLFSPVVDDGPADVATGLLARGYGVTVVSPAVATRETPAQRLVAAEREARLIRMRGAGAGVVEWERGDPLPVVLERATARGEPR